MKFGQVLRRYVVCQRRWVSSSAGVDTTRSSSHHNPATGPSTVKAPLLDLRGILSDRDRLVENLVTRKVPNAAQEVDALTTLRSQQLACENKLNKTRQARNKNGNKVKEASGQVSQLKKAGAASDEIQRAEECKDALVLNGRQLRADIQQLEEELTEFDKTLVNRVALLPNFTDPKAPVGADPVERCRVGQVPPPEKQWLGHEEILTQLGGVDLESGRMAAGSRGYMLTNDAAMLFLALQQFAMVFIKNRGFRPHILPSLVRRSVARTCGFHPRDSTEHDDVMFPVGLYDDHDPHCLAGTGEIALAATHYNVNLAPSTLPLRSVGTSPCFRPEAGTVGHQGLYRVHEFQKVEMFVVSDPEQSDAELENLVQIQTDLLQALDDGGKLCFKVLEMPTEELGSSAARKVDIEAWWPGLGRWGEVTSASNCTDYQARRLHVRIATERGLHFGHTLNATGIALPRTLALLVESYQRRTESGALVVDVPAVLQPYLGGLTTIGK